MELHFPHGSLFMLRNVSWEVSAQAVSEHLLGRLVLEALGLNTSSNLAAAADRYSWLLDLPHLCTEHEGGRIALVYGGVYYSDRGDDEDDVVKEEQWLGLGEAKNDDWEAALITALNDASKNGTSDNNRTELEQMLCAFRDIIRLHVNGHPSFNVKPLKVHRKPISVPVRAAQRK